jgi:GNAT superfamily N-acetyltransferase
MAEIFIVCFVTSIGPLRRRHSGLTFEEFKTHPDKGAIVILELDRKVIGYAIIVLFWSNEFAGDVVEIDELLVGEQYRGRGAGRRFFAWLETTYPDCVGLALQVSEQNSGATKLYESVGFKTARNNHLLKLLLGGAKRHSQQLTGRA